MEFYLNCGLEIKMDFWKGIKKGQKEFGECIAVIINTILLSIVYFIGVGLTSIFAKLFGKHFLDLQVNGGKHTCWFELNLNKKPIQEYYRQF